MISKDASPAAPYPTLPGAPQQPVSFSALPSRAQAQIFQLVLQKETPRQLRSLLGSHVVNVVVPKACEDGMEVSPQEEAAATQLLQGYERRIIAAIAARFFQPAEVGDAAVASYLRRFTTPGARTDRESLLNFFTQALMARGFPILGGKSTVQSAVIADETLEAALKDLHATAPHNLHNILLIFNPQRLELIEAIEGFHQAVATLSLPQLTQLAQQLFGNIPSPNGRVQSLALQWATLQSKAGTSTAREMKKQLTSLLKSHGISLQIPKQEKDELPASEPAHKKQRTDFEGTARLEAFMRKEPPSMEETLKIGNVLSRMMVQDIVPPLLPEIVDLAKVLFSAIPAAQLNHPELWGAQLSSTELITRAQQHVEEYISKFAPPEREERRAALEFMTDYLRTMLPSFFPILNMAPALIPFLIPTVQAHLVDNLDTRIFPALREQCPTVFHNLLVNIIDPSHKTFMDSLAEFQIDLFKLTPADRRRFVACLEGKEDGGPASAAIEALLERWTTLESLDQEGVLRAAFIAQQQ